MFSTPWLWSKEQRLPRLPSNHNIPQSEVHQSESRFTEIPNRDTGHPKMTGSGGWLFEAIHPNRSETQTEGGERVWPWKCLSQHRGCACVGLHCFDPVHSIYLLLLNTICGLASLPNSATGSCCTAKWEIAALHHSSSPHNRQKGEVQKLGQPATVHFVNGKVTIGVRQR